MYPSRAEVVQLSLQGASNVIDARLNKCEKKILMDENNDAQKVAAFITVHFDSPRGDSRNWGTAKRGK